MSKVIENPFEKINHQLAIMSSQLRQLLESKESQPKEKKIVGFREFVDEHYDGKDQTLYQKLSRGEVVPGAFKRPGSKFWLFELTVWYQHLREAQENQFKES